MVTINNYNIKNDTTFSIDAIVKTFIIADSIADLQSIRKQGLFENQKHLIIGGGSNLLFCHYFDGTIIKPAMKGIEIIETSNDSVIVEAQAGEPWDNLVAYCVENNLYGLENLSYIPGNVGASPVQNIGAYGVEVCQSIYQVETMEISTGEIHRFSNEECKFGYRDSIFKHEYSGKHIVCSVQFQLSKIPAFNTGYKDIAAYFKDKKELTLSNVRNAVIEIRKNKLPDPEITGNAGSFFKNPVVSLTKYKKLEELYPDIVKYALADGSMKIAAGWLIDRAGWKAYRSGDAGVHPNQALCLINYENATGRDIANLSNQIRESVKELFGIELEPEVLIL